MIEQLLYKNYRVPSARWRGWNYGWNGWYFVTICTKDRVCWFGEIKNRVMRLSDIGKLAEKFWQEIPKHFPYVHVDEFVVMPNHVHGIIEIDKGDSGLARNQDVASVGNARRDAINRVSTDVAIGGAAKEWNPMGTGTIGEIIRWFKGRVSFEIRRQCAMYFAWQPRFHDHIIRDEFELGRIRKYVRENPETWEDDELYVA